MAKCNQYFSYRASYLTEGTIKLFKYLLPIILTHSLFLNLQIAGHGFSANTQIKTHDPNAVSKRPKHWHKTPECWHSIRQIYEITLDHNLKAKSYNLQTGKWAYQPIKVAGQSETNCYVRIKIDQSIINVIKCTPSQEFYDTNLQRWIPAYQLHAGSTLFRDNSDGKGSSIKVINVDFITKPLAVYTIEIAHYHTFLVTGHNILTHNEVLAPTLFYALGERFLNTSLSCAAAGSALGPWGVVGSFAIGSLTAVGVTYCFGDWNRVWYKLKYDVKQVAQAFNKIKVYFKDSPEPHEQQSVDKSGKDSGGGDKDPDDEGRIKHYNRMSNDELFKSKKSYEKLIKQHKQKLADYESDPICYDNKNLLSKASKMNRPKIIEGRVHNILKQITYQEKTLNIIETLLKERGWNLN